MVFSLSDQTKTNQQTIQRFAKKTKANVFHQKCFAIFFFVCCSTHGVRAGERANWPFIDVVTICYSCFNVFRIWWGLLFFSRMYLLGFVEGERVNCREMEECLDSRSNGCSNILLFQLSKIGSSRLYLLYIFYI